MTSGTRDLVIIGLLLAIALELGVLVARPTLEPADLAELERQVEWAGNSLKTICERQGAQVIFLAPPGPGFPLASWPRCPDSPPYQLP